MRKAKWYNWVGDPIWDEYCLFAWIFILIPGISFLLFIIIGVATGFIEVV